MTTLTQAEQDAIAHIRRAIAAEEAKITTSRAKIDALTEAAWAVETMLEKGHADE